MFSFVDLPQSFTVIGINQAELQLRNPRELVARFLDLGRVESWDLHQDAVVRDGTDYRLADSKRVNTLANDLDRLVKHALSDFFVATFQPNQEGSAALNVQAKRDLLLWRPDRDNAGNDKQQHERHCQQPFP